MSTAEMVMSVTLEAAVPMWQAEFCRLPFVEVQRIAQESADVVASKGDALQFGGRKGEAAHAFSALARGIAAASMCPGGITFLGVRWEHHHPEAARD